MSSAVWQSQAGDISHVAHVILLPQLKKPP
jgi:hypothetical protein